MLENSYRCLHKKVLVKRKEKEEKKQRDENLKGENQKKRDQEKDAVKNLSKFIIYNL